MKLMKPLTALFVASDVLLAGLLIHDGCAGTMGPVKSAYDIASETCVKYFADHPAAASGAPGDICRDNAALQPFVDAILDMIPRAGLAASRAVQPQPESSDGGTP